jgi:hypothetical protein
VLPGILADRLEEMETEPFWSLVFHDHQRFVEQLLEQLKYVVFFDVFGACNLLGCCQRPTPAKDGEPAQQLALWFRKELITPVEGRAQRLVPRRCPSTSANQESKTIVQPGRELLSAQQLEPCGCQLNREWDTVELTADVRDNRYIWFRETKVGRGRTRTIDEQTDRLELRLAVHVWRRRSFWQR